ncbi:anti-sigma factor [Thauera sp. 2A1]|uniref:anti-sigma factor family protein n=1 Tax=Thauera sp. 2A1 TaxID=2570191 RepID=UPI001D174558|nr:zf-HC2 domain-containing protein [Thauera sp. 2A1]KAI5912589.1 zf-HC2 domain-containing protein [Thauera sp. 2A1]
MNSTCPPDEALSALVDDALPAEARAEVLTHSARCPHCAARLAEFRALHDAFLALPAVSLQVDFGARVVERLQAAAEPRVQASRHRGWRARLRSLFRPLTAFPLALSPYAGAAAALVMGVWLGGMLLQVVDSPSQPSPPSANVTLAAMSLFDAVPPGNLCPRADACGPIRSAQ